MKIKNRILEWARHRNMSGILHGIVTGTPNLRLIEARKQHEKVNDILEYVEELQRKKKVG